MITDIFTGMATRICPGAAGNRRPR